MPNIVSSLLGMLCLLTATATSATVSPAFRMDLDESIEMQTQSQPAEFISLEKYSTPKAKAYFAVSRRGRSVIARKALIEKQYSGWKKRLREILRTENQGRCGDPWRWAQTEAKRTSEYTFCPGEASDPKMKSLDQVSHEIIRFIRNEEAKK